MSELTVGQLIFIIAAPILLVTAAILFGIVIYHAFYIKKNHNKLVYKKVNDIVLDNDYLLINDFSFEIDKKSIRHIDHIIFGEKFIYLIFPKLLLYKIKGDVSDISLVTYNENGKRIYENNLLNEMSFIKKAVSITYGLPIEYFVALAVCNNDAIIDIKNMSNSLKMVHLNELKKEIKAIEKSEEYSLDQEALLLAANKIAKFNLNKKDERDDQFED